MLVSLVRFQPSAPFHIRIWSARLAHGVTVMGKPFLSARLLAVAACGASPLAPELTYRPIAQGTTVITLPGTRVFVDASSWNAFATQMGLRAVSNNPDEPVPSVDFSSETLVVMMLGQRPTSGHTIEVQRISDTGSRVVVEAREIKPCVGATVLTYPVLAIAVASRRSDVSVEWTVVSRCS